MKVSFYFFAAVAAISFGAQAEEHGGTHSNEIPGYVLWQVINLTILAVALYKYGKDPIKDYFMNRQAEYLKQAEKSRAIFLEAEKEYADVKVRLETLSSTADTSIEKAKQDADEQKKQMIADARAAAVRLKEEAQLAAKLEAHRDTVRAKNEIVLQALSGARHVLTTDIGGQDHQRLQSDFNKNIETVSP